MADHDITRHKQAEAAILEQGAKFRYIADAVRDAVIQIDAEGRIALWNQAATRMFGYPASEAMGQNLHELLVPARFLPAHRQAFPVFQATGQGAAVNKTVELAGLRKDGTEFPLELTLSGFQIDGRWEAMGIIRDITERKRAQQQAQEQMEELRALNEQLASNNEKLQQVQNQLLQSEKMASIGVLAAGVAHEINNPIGFVNSNLGSLETYCGNFLQLLDAYARLEPAVAEPNTALAEVQRLKQQIDLDYLREDIKALLGESRDGIARVKKIIQDLKEFSHVDADDVWAPADINHILDTTLNVVWNELKYHCEVKKEYGELPLVECLTSQLNQVFMNLLVNAAHAIETKGIVTVRTGVRGDEVWVEIIDTGKGIPPANLKKLFDPFFTTKLVGKGTGLGLSVSYSIIEKHHGRIEVDSEVGKGATFRVWLPVRAGESP